MCKMLNITNMLINFEVEVKKPINPELYTP